MKFALLRHGKSRSANLSDDEVCPSDDCNPLTAQGVEQIEAFAAGAGRILTGPRVCSSSMRRARESADVVARHLDLTVEVWPELREILPVDEDIEVGRLRRRYRQFWEDFYRGNAQDVLVARARLQADALWKKILSRNRPSSDLILVSHGGLIEVLMAKLLGGYARVGYTIEYLLQPGSFHLLEIALAKGEIAHLRLHYANKSISKVGIC